MTGSSRTTASDALNNSAARRSGSSGGGAAAALKEQMRRAVGDPQTSRKPTEVANEEKFANIKANPFYAILYDKSTSPEEKRAAIVKVLEFEGTATENAERIRAFNEFKEFLQLQRQRMAKEFMNLADTDSFAELKSVIDDMNKGLIEFDERMRPLTEILDAVYKLRTGGDDLVFKAFADIEAEKKAEAEKQGLLDEQQGIISELNSQVEQTNDRIAALGADRHWKIFGGGIKKGAREQILTLQEQNRRRGLKAQEVQAKIEEIRSGANERENLLPEEFRDAKAKLRELLDITSEEHKGRQRALINAARVFVEKAQHRTGSVLEHLVTMEGRVERVSNANQVLRGMYAIMDEGSKLAADGNKKQRDTLAEKKAAEGLGAIEAMKIDERLGAIDNHIAELDETVIDTSKTLQDLSEQGGRVLTMRDRNRIQMGRTRALMTSGIGGVADRLVTVLNGVAQAALSESSDLMSDSIRQMDARTREVTQREVMQKVLGAKLQNDELTRALEDAGEFRDVLATGTEMYRKQVADSLRLVDEMAESAEALKQTVDEARAAHADARGQVEDTVAKPKPGTPANSNDPEDPFAFGPTGTR